jgi:hypothetical protein
VKKMGFPKGVEPVENEVIDVFIKNDLTVSQAEYILERVNKKINSLTRIAEVKDVLPKDSI